MNTFPNLNMRPCYNPAVTIGCVSWLFLLNGAYGSETKIWEENIVLPTYKVTAADPNPRFYAGRTYQGAKATFYPYPVSDQMTEQREEQSYKAVYLENDYIKISVLPELGGRIFTALDKGNHYDFFYRQHVIKPALIGMLGAWISGGVEWNVPHHHRASSFMPVDYEIRKEADGSKTLWVGETELRHRTKWIVGLTLRPGHSYIEMTVKLFNRTPEAQSLLFWINPAVHANTNYQVIFPPSTEWAVQHSKPEFASWPIARQVYGGTDYTRGVDISWWKNHPSPVSFFAWNCQEDFFGGYDHGKRAGVIQISNHHVSPGKKFFEWGNGAEGEMWTKILTDQDGPYLELMAGSYSDNQPDYSWSQPSEVKVFKHFWYPIRRLDGIKNANTEAAVNLETSNRVARIAFNTTADHHAARVLVLGADRQLLDQKLHISPNLPFETTLALPPDVDTNSIKATLFDANGHELVTYQPAPRANSPMPQPVKRPANPKDIQSSEELYLTGLRIEQLYSPSYDPIPYYQEALWRDPGDYRANTALGSLYCREGRFEEAEPLLRAAVDRVSENYIRSKDCEAVYYLGVSMRAQGKNEAARDAFYRAIWSQAWQAAGYCQLAELACFDKNFPQALELAQKSIAAGVLNTKALELQASLLRKLNRRTEAPAVLEQILSIDPLNARARHERVLLSKAAGHSSTKEIEAMRRALRQQTGTFLELAIDYANCGLFEEATDALQLELGGLGKGCLANPLVYYYLAYFEDQLGRSKAADDHLKLAAEAPSEFCFPFQVEAAHILSHAMKRNPRDARAPYYLGNLLFDNQPLKAVAAWETAVNLDPGFASAQRNLGLARAQASKDIPGAIDCLEKAVTIDPQDPRFYYELDVLYESGGATVEKRLKMLNRNAQIVAKRDDALTRRVSLLTAAGEPEASLAILREHHFHNWEGSGSLHDVYVDACIQAGSRSLKAGKPADALALFQAAIEYPENQEVGKGKRAARVAEIYYHVGLAQEALGQTEEAKKGFDRAAHANENRASEGQFCKGLSLQKAGDPDEATRIFEALEKHGYEELTRESEVIDYFAKFGEKHAERLRLAEAHFLSGLGALGLGKKEDAAQQFRQALELHPAHLGAIRWSKES